MPQILNISGLYNVNSKTIRSKINFDIGQVFLAKIADMDPSGLELVLKTLDGWQFSAMLNSPLDNYPKGLIKFVVTGFEDGKLLLSVQNNKEEEAAITDSITALIKNANLNLSEDDYEMLNTMVKYQMPLDKENIGKVKNLLDFKDKITKDPEESDNFINKFISSRNIDANSEEGAQIKNILKDFFGTLKSTDDESLIFLMSQDVDINPENLESFNKLFNSEEKGVKELFTSIEDIAVKAESENISSDSKVNLQNEEVHEKTFKEFLQDKVQVFEEPDKTLKGDIKENAAEVSKEEIKVKDENSNRKTDTKIDLKETEVKNENIKETEVKNVKEDVVENGPSASKNSSNLSTEKKLINKLLSMDKNEIEHVLSSKPEDLVREKIIDKKDIEVFKEIKKEFEDNKLQQNKSIKALEVNGDVKEQIKNKVEILKDAIMKIKDLKAQSPEDFNKLIPLIKEKLSDIKMYNKISDSYYCLDIPMQYKEKKYDCSLIIKDQRKKGKKIDSKDVKLVVTVGTENLGNVDAYIKVYMNNLNLNLKCGDGFLKVLESEKDSLIKSLNSMGFSTNLHIEERHEPANLITCQQFFEDNSLNTVDVRV